MASLSDFVDLSAPSLAGKLSFTYVDRRLRISHVTDLVQCLPRRLHSIQSSGSK